MRAGEDTAILDGTKDSIETALLDVVVPHASNINIEDALRLTDSQDDGRSSLLPSIPQRQFLFFDETVAVFVVLRVPYLGSVALKSYLSRLAINLTAYAFNEPQKPSHGENGASQSPTRDTVWTEVIKKSEDPIIVVQGSEEDSSEEDSPYVYAIWKLDPFLGRPRIRIQNPKISFTITANLQSGPQMNAAVVEEEYLPNQVPAGLNLLESLKDDPALAGVNPRLSASRVSRVVPNTRPVKQSNHHSKSFTTQPFPAIPAISSRIRYSSLTASANHPIMIASLDFDVTPFANCDVRLQEIKLDLLDGVVQAYNEKQGADLPITCRPRDEMTFLYQLTQKTGVDVTSSQNANIKTLEISIAAAALVTSNCVAQISMKWRTSVDFSAPLNPSFGTPRQLIQRSHRPSSLPVTPSASVASASVTTAPASNVQGSAIVAGTSGRQRTDSISDFGVTATFSGPQNVYVGETFRWQVFVVNRSNQDRKLALVVIPRRRKAETKKHAYRVSSSSVSGRKDEYLAEAVIDENIVYAMQKSANTEPAELVNMSTDVRIGPLAPSACHTADLKFLALAKGVLHIEAVRIVDVSTNEATDIQDLPSIVALQRESNV
ncbi:MAG: hypothetical protein M1812_001832 [Candelaria pacifica]|nr:MAG: hypothetical protein M1812_001832 [Candelaria pacifica]